MFMKGCLWFEVKGVGVFKYNDTRENFLDGVFISDEWLNIGGEKHISKK